MYGLFVHPPLYLHLSSPPIDIAPFTPASFLPYLPSFLVRVTHVCTAESIGTELHSVHPLLYLHLSSPPIDIAPFTPASYFPYLTSFLV
jgi:hypothetical protein